MNLETPLKTLNDWYTWVIRLDHQHHKSERVIERTKENVSKKPAPRFYFPRKGRDPNEVDVNRLTFDERTQLMKEGWCFKCRKTGHRANKCPEETQDKGKKKDELKKKMNGKEFYTHVQAIFKDLDEEEKDKFLEEAQNVGF